jgi:hypothetical protein
MAFDLFAQQQQILARLAPHAASAGIDLVDTFAAVDLTDEGGRVIAAQTFLTTFDPAGQVGSGARHTVEWSFDLYVDTVRASDAQKTAGAALFSSALGALLGWEVSPGCAVQSGKGRESGFDGRVLRLSFGFLLPVFTG